MYKVSQIHTIVFVRDQLDMMQLLLSRCFVSSTQTKFGAHFLGRHALQKINQDLCVLHDKVGALFGEVTSGQAITHRLQGALDLLLYFASLEDGVYFLHDHFTQDTFCCRFHWFLYNCKPFIDIHIFNVHVTDLLIIWQHTFTCTGIYVCMYFFCQLFQYENNTGEILFVVVEYYMNCT